MTETKYDSHNWPEIETVYLSSSISLISIATKYNISYSYVRKYASEHEWAQKREAFWKDVHEEITAITAVKAGLEKRDFDQAASLAADLIIGKIVEQFDGIDDSIKGYDKKGNEIQRDILDKLASASVTLRSAIDSKYRILDVPSPTVRLADVTPAPVDDLPLSDIESMIDRKLEHAAMLVDMTFTHEQSGGNGNGNGNGNGEHHE